jgi:hypothetical protein
MVRCCSSTSSSITHCPDGRDVDTVERTSNHRMFRATIWPRRPVVVVLVLAVVVVALGKLTATTFFTHKTCCFPIIHYSIFTHTHTQKTTVEYQTYPSMLWHPCRYERSVVENLLRTQFHDYVEQVRTTDCQATLRRLLAVGPPIYLHDQHALPLPDGETHICAVWFAGDGGTVRSAKLVGAVEGEERDKLWTELKSFIVVEGKEPGDDDEDDDEDDINDDINNNTNNDRDVDASG